MIPKFKLRNAGKNVQFHFANGLTASMCFHNKGADVAVLQGKTMLKISDFIDNADGFDATELTPEEVVDFLARVKSYGC